MKAARIDYRDGAFHVTIREGWKSQTYAAGSYPEAIRLATAVGVERRHVALTEAAQAAAVAACFGGRA